MVERRHLLVKNYLQRHVSVQLNYRCGSDFGITDLQTWNSLILICRSTCKGKKVKVKWSSYRPGVAQRVGRGIALLLNDRGTRRGWVVSSTPQPHFTPGKEPVPILQEAGWTPGPVWTGGKSRPHRDSIPGRPARSQSLYRLSYNDRPVSLKNPIIIHMTFDPQLHQESSN